MQPNQTALHKIRALMATEIALRRSPKPKQGEHKKTKERPKKKGLCAKVVYPVLDPSPAGRIPANEGSKAVVKRNK